MQRKAFLAVVAMLAMLGGCAQRDPNLVVRGLGEFSRSAGDYTVRVNVYDLDEKGRPRLVAKDDPSMRGFVTRTLEGRGYVMKSAGPARYALEVDLLCGNMRNADMGLMSEELRVPAESVGPGYSTDVHYWLPDKGLGADSRETQDLRNSMLTRHHSANTERGASSNRGGAPFGSQTPDFCQGRVLVTLTPAGPGSQREVFVGRAATDDCPAAPNCPVNVCRTSIEHELVDMLQNRF